MFSSTFNAYEKIILLHNHVCSVLKVVILPRIHSAQLISQQGESMTREEVRKMIAEVDENDDGKLDYGEVCTGS